MAKGNAEGLEALPVGTEADCCFETKYNDALVKTMRNFDLERQNDSSNAEEDYNIAVLWLSSIFPMIPSDLTDKKVRIFPKGNLNGFFHEVNLYGDWIEIVDKFYDNWKSPIYGSSIYRIKKIWDFWEETMITRGTQGVLITHNVCKNEICSKVEEVCANSDDYEVIVQDIDN